MNIQAEIRQKLLEGKNPLDLIAEGYSRNSVYFELKKIQSQLPVSAAPSALADVVRLKKAPKSEKEIADIEAANEQLTGRVAALEGEVAALRPLIRKAVNTALLAILREFVDEKSAREYADGWVERSIENPTSQPGTVPADTVD